MNKRLRINSEPFPFTSLLQVPLLIFSKLVITGSLLGFWGGDRGGAGRQVPNALIRQSKCSSSACFLTEIPLSPKQPD